MSSHLWERFLSLRSKSVQPTQPERVDRYPSVGIHEGSKLWEGSAAVLQGTMNSPNDLESAHLLPMDGYLAEGKSRAGFQWPGGKGSGLWEGFWTKGRWIWGPALIV
jgi:hypothetical protein